MARCGERGETVDGVGGLVMRSWRGDWRGGLVIWEMEFGEGLCPDPGVSPQQAAVGVESAWSIWSASVTPLLIVLLLVLSVGFDQLNGNQLIALHYVAHPRL